MLEQLRSATRALSWFRSLVVILGITLSVTGPLRPIPTQADLAVYAYLMSGGNPDDICAGSDKGHQHNNCALACTVLSLTLGPPQQAWKSDEPGLISTIVWPKNERLEALHPRYKAQARAPPESV